MKQLLFCVFILINTLIASAQTDLNIEKSSMIIALDVRAPRVNGPLWNSKSVSRAIRDVISKNNINPDLISGVLYGIDENSTSPRNFSKLITLPKSSKSKDFSDILTSLHSNLPNGTFFSITSFAKPYTLIALKDKALTNRTYMVIITDGKYNGNDDYYGEVSFVRNNFTAEGKAEFKKSIKDVQTNYFCEYIGSKQIAGGFVQLYEFVPLQQYFALESVLDFPHEVIAKRYKDCYKVQVSVNSIENNDYEISKLVLSVKNDNKILTSQEIRPNTTFSFDIANEDIDHVELEIMSWIKLCDGVYNNTILHPQGSKLQGSEGLTRTINISKDSKALILGVIPLSDAMFKISFWTSSQTVAANSWGWIIIFLILSIVIFVIYKSNIYKPVPEETTI